MRLMTWLNDSNTKLHAGKRIRHQALSLVKPGQGYDTFEAKKHTLKWDFTLKPLKKKHNTLTHGLSRWQSVIASVANPVPFAVCQSVVLLFQRVSLVLGIIEHVINRICLDRMLEGDSLIMICLAKGSLVTTSSEKPGEKKSMKMIVYGQEDHSNLIDGDDSDELRSVWSGSDEEKTLWTGSEGDDDDDIPTEPYPNENSDPYIDKLFEFDEKPKYRTISELLKSEQEPEELSPGKQARKLAVEKCF
ncbi:hypothetical protein Tco_1255176 [Tanacetum coccineum]